MSAEANSSTNSALMVAEGVDSSPLRELVRDGKGYREVEMEDADSEAGSSGAEQEEMEWDGKSRGRPNYGRRAVLGARPQ